MTQAPPSASGPERARPRIDEFIRPVRPVAPDAPCAAVYDRFVAEPALLGVPVCAPDGGVVGLVDRYDFLRQLAHSYGRALFDRKPVMTLADRDVLVVERDIDILELQRKIEREHPDALVRGFAVTADGRYAGYGDALALLRASLAETGETNARLAAALEEARGAARMKSKFLANVSHELRTPLNAIIGFSEMMAGATLGPIPPRYREYAGDILASGRQLLDLINDLLDMAKIEAGEMRADPCEIDVETALYSAQRQMRDLAARAGVTLSVDSTGVPPIVVADPRHFRQMLLNLLSNAIKFTGQGGDVALFAATDPSGAAVVGVRDTGIGMDAAGVELALRPFGQVANALTRAHDGTGLGLPIVKALAELNGAEFRIDSAPGKGTRATLRFPANAIGKMPQALTA
ncbi:MAG: ATP-binding protein [Tagaea sp.]|nr:ATP-binding protein [Tagaea sp.]